MFGISGFELTLVFVFVLIIFGPDKLPELGRTLGKAMRTFKRAQEDMERLIKAEMYAKPSPKPEEPEPEVKEPAPSREAAGTTAASIYEAAEEPAEEPAEAPAEQPASASDAASDEASAARDEEVGEG